MPRAGWHSWFDFRLGRLHARQRRPLRRAAARAGDATRQRAGAGVGTTSESSAGLGVYGAAVASAKVIAATRAAVGTVRTGRAGAMSEKSSFQMYRGEDFEITFQVRAKDIPPEGIGAWVIQFSMIRCDDDGSAIAGKVSLGLIACSVVDPTHGQFRASIPNAYTLNKEVGLYKWDCRRQNAGQKATLADGTMDVLPEVTP